MGAKLIKNKESPFDEGEVYYKWEEGRIRANKNVISVTTGTTGSGKSMLDLRRAELSYKKRFGEDFPVDTNCCFSVAELMKRISSGDLKKGDILILEEAGFNAGSQDWQSKTTKMFNYLLQTFRSMNICLYMNLPVLSMLAKQARQLVHIHLETCGIDFETSQCKVKALAHQLNQQTGKSYWKFLRVKYMGKVRRIERMAFALPSEGIRKKYEAKKYKFLMDMTSEFARELMEKEREKLQKLERKKLEGRQLEYYEAGKDGLSNPDVCRLIGMDVSQGKKTRRRIEQLGYAFAEIPKKSKRATKKD